ncbi:hypothetical protein SRABI128_05781 [Microbacterium sp. Bi128]|nr:hypothetical protein SRABI128_05781 [Microbacterium sp. Bi128]
MEQVTVLRHHAEGCAHRVEREVTDVHARAGRRAAESDGAGVDVVQARQELRNGGLARPGGADEGHRLARLHPEADAVQHFLAAAGVQGQHVLQGGQRDFVRRGVGEADVVELHRERTWRGGHRVRLLLDERLEVQDLEDAFEADQGAHDLDPCVRKCRERRVQAGEQQCQHDDVARVQLPGEREPAAQAVDQCQGQGRDQCQRRDEGELQHGGADADVPDAAGPEGELAGFLVGAAEELDQRGAGRGEALGHLGAHGGVVFGGFAPQIGQLGAHPAGRDQEDRQQDHGEHGHKPRFVQHHREGQRQGHDVADHAGERAGEC